MSPHTTFPDVHRRSSTATPAADLPYVLYGATPAELLERIGAERRERPFLLYRDGDGAQRIVDLGEAPPRLTIGRSPTNPIALGWDREVSRVHASLERLGDEWSLVDDGRARNGSFIDGARLHGRSRLRDGDAIGVGRTTMLFRSPTRRESLPTAPSPEPGAPKVSAGQLRVLTALCRPLIQSSVAVPASNRDIADELVVGVETVKTHLRALFELFALTHAASHGKRTLLAQRALETGLVRRRDLEVT